MNQRTPPPYRLAVFLLWLVFLISGATTVHAQTSVEYPLGAGDVVRVQVFQNPDLTIETRVAEDGSISYPLIGSVKLGGLSVAAAEKKIAEALQSGGFLRQPQVNIILVQIRGNLVSVLGQVNRPGRFPLETANVRLSDILATAGGLTPTGDEVVIVTGQRDGKAFRAQVDVPSIYLTDKPQDDILLRSGDTVYVRQAPVFYIYGEAQRPGSFRIERGMTVMQALAQGGGPTARGSESRLRLSRKMPDGSIQQAVPKLTDPIQPNDVIYVNERLF